MKTKGHSGEKVDVSGVYKNKYGKQITLIKNDVFPNCPEKDCETEWELDQV